MNEHTRISDSLPEYAAGRLGAEQRAEVEQHLRTCEECQADLALWSAVAGEVQILSQAVTAPRGLAERALAQREARQANPAVERLGFVFQLLRSQMPLVHREIWPASTAVIGLGFVAAVIAAHSGFVYAIAPLIAATCVSLIYGPENDPAFELTRSTPTSPRQILLARLVLVFGYNLGLVLVATVGLLPVIRDPITLDLILGWLAPMAFLAAAALILSVWIGAQNAIAITYLVWLAHFFLSPLVSPQSTLRLSPVTTELIQAYQGFWQSPALLIGLAILLTTGAIWLAGRQTWGLNHPA